MVVINLTRRIYRILVLTLWFVIMFIVALFCCWGKFRAIKRITNITHIWAKGIAKILGIKLEIEGDTHSYKNKLIIANHSSYLDIIVHAALFPIRFTPKNDIRKWPILGQYIEASRPIWIDRSSRQKAKLLIKEFTKTIKHGIPLIVYPEGSTSDNRGDLLKFKTTSFEVAKNCSSSLLPLICYFEDTIDNKPLAWYGDMTFLPHLWRVLAYKEIRVTVKILPEIKINESENRKELALRAYEIMNKSFHEVAESRKNTTIK